jgi:RHS repeat-associated protein
MNLAAGYNVSFTSFSFYYKSNTGGYIGWVMRINGTQVGSGVINPSGGNTLTFTGLQSLQNAVNNLTGTVTVTITLSSGNHSSSGAYRIDNFILNGYVTQIQNGGGGANATNGYRYGFNGKENDNDIALDNYDFDARIYDGRIGKWLSLDKVNKADRSSYQYCAANPVNYIDPDGKDEIHFYFIKKTKEVSVYSNGHVSFGQMQIGQMTAVAITVKKSGPDQFYHHAVSINTTSNTITDKITQFYPGNPSSRSGLTSESFLFWTRKDRDYATLIKYTNGNKALQDYFNQRASDKGVSEYDRGTYSSMKSDRHAYNFFAGVSHYGQLASAVFGTVSFGAGLIGGLRTALTLAGEGSVAGRIPAGFTKVTNIADVGNQEGLYLFKHSLRGNLPYVGETGQFATRMGQHTASGAYTPGTPLWFRPMTGSTPLQRMVQETQLIINLGGKYGQTQATANLIYSVSEKTNAAKSLGIVGF